MVVAFFFFFDLVLYEFKDKPETYTSPQPCQVTICDPAGRLNHVDGVKFK